MAGYWNNPPKSSVDEEADHLQKLIRERFETLTNSAEGSRQAQQLAKIFKKYDVDGSGSLDFPLLQRVLVEIRCHQARESAQRALFDRYDPELDGNISLQEMLDGVFSLKPHPLAKKENRGMVDKIREQLTKRGGMNGIRSLARVFRIMDDSGNGRITHEEFLYGMHDMGVELAKQDVGHVVELFDRDKDGNIDFNELLWTLRGKLNPRRRELVDLAWTQLDRHGDGVVTMADLMDYVRRVREPGGDQQTHHPGAGHRAVRQGVGQGRQRLHREARVRHLLQGHQCEHRRRLLLRAHDSQRVAPLRRRGRGGEHEQHPGVGHISRTAPRKSSPCRTTWGWRETTFHSSGSDSTCRACETSRASPSRINPEAARG